MFKQLTASTVICPNDPLMCCPPGDVCIPAEFACCPAADPELCPDEFCYPEGSTCCSPSGACPASERCCGPYCCTGTDQCCSGIEGCCDIEASCCTDGCCDAPNTQCCGTEYCCPPGANCCDGEYCCPEGEECCNDGCCAEGTTCCGEWCCAEGTTCCGGEECCGENFICDPDEPGKCLPVMEFQYTPLVMDQTVKNMCMRIGPSNQMILHWSDVRNDGGKCDGCCSNVTVPSGPFVGEATSCDEFPFATSAEALLPGAHLACVDAYENSFQGNWIARYRAALGLVQGQKFLVKVIGFDCASVNPADLLGCGGVPGGTWA